LGLSRSTFAELERGVPVDIGLIRAATLTAVLGGRLSVQLYPGGSPLRDAGHIALLGRFDSRVPAAWRITHESPIGPPGDGRAWDRRLDGPTSIGVEAETRLWDLQALERRMQLKARDSRVRRMILLIAGSQRNREALRAALPALRATFPLSTAEVMRSLGEGRDPGANGLVVL
jgi:hypothetical protein